MVFDEILVFRAKLLKKGWFYMYNLSEISNIIKSLAKNKNVTVKQLLNDCNINKGFIYDLEHKNSYPSCDKLSRIADYLDVSVDYLLGRTDKPNVDASPATASAPTTQEPKLNEDELELLEMYRSLSKRARHELMVTTYEMKDRDELERDREIYINYDAI